MVPISLRYDGNLLCTVTHDPSGASFTTDAPLDNGGRAASFSPTDLLATSLLSCIVTTMALVAERKGFVLAGMSAAIEKHMVSTPERRVGKLVVTLNMPPNLTPDQRTLLERVAKTCPVRKSISPDIDVVETYVYAD